MVPRVRTWCTVQVYRQKHCVSGTESVSVLKLKKKVITHIDEPRWAQLSRRYTVFYF